MTLAPGTRLGPYEIAAPLGAGGMGEVYRARDPRLGRDVAVKVLPAAAAADADALRRLDQEARAAGALNHPNLITVFDVGVHEGRSYVVAELLEGETLRQSLKRAPPPLRKTLDCAAQIALGLAAAHDKGIVHRDLKPENLFLTVDGRVKILDFGLAKVRGPAPTVDDATGSLQGDAPGTEPGTILGTLGYMSPEQVRGLPADPRSDIFSLGAVLYEMLSGRRAFRGETAAETMTAILREDPPELEATEGARPAAFERLVRRCLEKRPEERFQSARDVAFALDAVSTGSGPRLGTAPAPGRRRLTYALLGLALLATHAGIFGVARRTARVSHPSFTRLTFQRVAIGSARFAPDGQSFVYSAARETDSYEIMAGRIGSPEWRGLGLPHGHVASISSRGELALVLQPKGLYRGRLARAPLAGGAAREVHQEVTGADWGTDGEALAVTREPAGVAFLEFPVGHELYRRSLGGLGWPRVSPSGDEVAFVEFSQDGKASIKVVARSGRQEPRSSEPLAGAHSIRGIAWGPAGDEIWFAAGDPNGSSRLYAEKPGGRRRTLATIVGSVRLLDVSSDGRAILARDTARSEAVLLAADGAERDVSWFDGSVAADLSLDGTAVLLSEERAAAGRSAAGLVYLRKTDGSPAVRLGEGRALALSPDAKWALALSPDPAPHLVVLPTGAGEPRALPTGGLTAYLAASFFPDGRRILILGAQGEGSRCFVQDLDGGDPRPVTPEGTHLLQEQRPVSPDGAWIFAGVRGERSHRLYPVAGGEPRPIPGLGPGSQELPLRWSPDGRSLYVARFGGISGWVDRLDIATGRRQPWKQIGPSDPVGVGWRRLVLGADGKSYVASYGRALSELYLAEGLR